MTADTTLAVLNNGRPGKSEILKLARPVLIPPRQGFSVTADMLLPTGATAGAVNAQDFLGVLNTNTLPFDSCTKDVRS